MGSSPIAAAASQPALSSPLPRVERAGPLQIRSDVRLCTLGLLDSASLSHAGNASGVPSVVWPRERAFSRRKLAPMPLLELVLAPHLPHPLPPLSQWEEPPPDPPIIPPFYRLADVIPSATLRSTRKQLAAIDRCIGAARDGDVFGAMRMRPRPLVIHKPKLFTSQASGFGPLDLRPALLGSGPIEQLLHSRWPSRPPNSELKIDFFLWFAHLFPDLQSVSYVAHGMPDHSSMPLTVVLCPPAVSALQAIATFVTSTEKDLRNGFTSPPFSFCPTWPFIGDSCSVHWRHEKARLCWDKSGPRKIPSFSPFNETLPLDSLPSLVFVNIATSCRELAIFASSGAPVRMWKFDLSKAYRRGGRQLADVWKQGRVTHLGCTVDWRGQFGDASQPNLSNRIWGQCLWVTRKLILALDELFPSRDPVVCAWVAFRSSNGLFVKLGDAWAFFDDVHGGGVHDQIFCSDGSPLLDDSGEQIFRSSLHFNAGIVVFGAAGFSFEDDKKEPPALVMGLLGALVRVRYQHIVVHPDKRVAYISELRIAEEASSLERDFLNSLAHKLVYCACIMVRLRPWLSHIFKCLRARSSTARALLSNEARSAFRKARLALESADRHFLPFASIEAFPSLGDDMLVTYADAAGEGEFAGMGFWFVVGSVCFLYCEEWEECESHVPIHAREGFISTAAVMSAHALHPGRSCCLEYTDNSPCEVVHDSQASRCAFLHTIVDARAEFFDASGLCALPQRVKSKDNKWADDLSRGLWRRVIVEVVALGLKPIWVSLPLVACTLRASLRSVSGNKSD